MHSIDLNYLPYRLCATRFWFAPTSLVLFTSYEYSTYSYIQLYCLVNFCVLYSNSELVDSRITIIYSLECPPNEWSSVRCFAAQHNINVQYNMSPRSALLSLSLSPFSRINSYRLSFSLFAQVPSLFFMYLLYTR